MSGRLFGMANGNARITERAVEIMRYLAEHRPDRFDAAELALVHGVHVKTVRRIVTGRRRAMSPGTIQKPVELLPDGDVLVAAIRCPECGAMVYPPCKVCAIRRGEIPPVEFED